jgi:hypothetical protein
MVHRLDGQRFPLAIQLQINFWNCRRADLSSLPPLVFFVEEIRTFIDSPRPTDRLSDQAGGSVGA